MRVRSVALVLILTLAVVVAGFALSTRGGMSSKDCDRLLERARDYRQQGDIVESKDAYREHADKC